MGVFCCCPCSEDFEEYTNPSNPLYRRCICLRYFFHPLFSGYTAIFQRLEGRTTPAPVQGASTLASTGLGDATTESSIAETFQLVPRPASYDSEPRYSRQQRDGLVSRREKATNHVQDDLQMTRRSGSSSGIGIAKRWSSTDIAGECKTNRTELEKFFSAKAFGMGYVPTSEDEDVCPTCLEEYTHENPKIVAKCSHHFHLGCIYEWMERSDTCPVCGKEMDFCETP